MRSMLHYIIAGSVSPDDGEHCSTPALTGQEVE